MIRDLKSLAVFHSVIKNKGFAKAARELRMTPTNVSQHVSKLEESLGTTLMYRSTRSFSLTQSGETVAEMAAEMIDNLEKGYERLSDTGAELSGDLKITLPSFNAEDHILCGIWEFSHAHRSVNLFFEFTDKAVDLVKDGFDLGIRYGRLTDTGHKTTEIGSFQVIPVCSERYLAGRQAPSAPKDLAQLDFISLGPKLKSNQFEKDGKQVTFTPKNERIELNSVERALQAIESDLGYGYFPENTCKAGLASGALVRLIPEWNIPPFGIFALRPKDARPTDLSSKLVEHLVNSRK